MINYKEEMIALHERVAEVYNSRVTKLFKDFNFQDMFKLNTLYQTYYDQYQGLGDKSRSLASDENGFYEALKSQIRAKKLIGGFGAEADTLFIRLKLRLLEEDLSRQGTEKQSPRAKDIEGRVRKLEEANEARRQEEEQKETGLKEEVQELRRVSA